MLGVDIPQRAPDGAVALEAGAEGNLPHAVAAPHVAFGLYVCQHVPGTPCMGQSVA